jgi:hypothetical protein
LSSLSDGYRRKLNVRGSAVSDPIIIDADLMRALGRYVEAKIDEISCLVAKFLTMFLTESPLVESYEGDNFILRNGKMLAAWCVLFYINYVLKINLEQCLAII